MTQTPASMPGLICEACGEDKCWRCDAPQGGRCDCAHPPLDQPWRPLSQTCPDCYEFGHDACGCGECGSLTCGSLDKALSVPFTPGPGGECVHGGCTADLDALPVIDDHEFIDALNDWQGEP